MIRLPSVEHKKIIPKYASKKSQLTYRGAPIRTRADPQRKLQKQWKEWNNIFQTLRGKKSCQPRITHTVSLKMKENISTAEQKSNNEWLFAKMTGPNHDLSIWTLNISGLNTSIKHHRLVDLIRKQNHFYCLQKTHLAHKEMWKLKVKGWRKIFQAAGKQRWDGVAILSDSTDFNVKSIKRDEEVKHIMIKGSIQPEEITILNEYATNTMALSFVKQNRLRYNNTVGWREP